MASYDVTQNITLRLNVDNVFDELYASSLNWGTTRGALGPPRTYWLSASFKY
jgi:catecholate siderophore receptor